MSAKGVALAAKVFALMQETRGELLAMGNATTEGHQDMRLAQMLERGKDAMKVDFCRITAEGPGYHCPRCGKSDRLEGHYYGDQDMDYCNRCEWSFFKRPQVARKVRKHRDRKQ